MSVDTLIVLVEPAAAWSPWLIGELFTPGGQWLWDGRGVTEDDLVVELTKRQGRAEMLALLYPDGFRLDVRYPVGARSA